jgi:hypothetical protein
MISETVKGIEHAFITRNANRFSTPLIVAETLGRTGRCYQSMDGDTMFAA